MWCVIEDTLGDDGKLLVTRVVYRARSEFMARAERQRLDDAAGWRDLSHVWYVRFVA